MISLKINDALAMLREAMSNHPELADWTAKANSRRNAAGLCSYRDKTIYLSRPYVEVNNPFAVMQVIIHEIAHALLPPRVGHGPEWYALAARLGYKHSKHNRPGAISAEDGYTMPTLWKASCPNNHEVGGVNRRPSVRYACALCRKRHGQTNELVYTNSKTGETFKVSERR